MPASSNKERLAFCALTQDGDSEGCLRLHELPTPAQAEAIRKVLKIRKRVEYSPEVLARRVEQMAAARSQTLAARQAGAAKADA